MASLSPPLSSPLLTTSASPRASLTGSVGVAVDTAMACARNVTNRGGNVAVRKPRWHSPCPRGRGHQASTVGTRLRATHTPNTAQGYRVYGGSQVCANHGDSGLQLVHRYRQGCASLAHTLRRAPRGKQSLEHQTTDSKTLRQARGKAPQLTRGNPVQHLLTAGTRTKDLCCPQLEQPFRSVERLLRECGYTRPHMHRLSPPFRKLALVARVGYYVQAVWPFA